MADDDARNAKGDPAPEPDEGPIEPEVVQGRGATGASRPLGGGFGRGPRQVAGGGLRPAGSLVRVGTFLLGFMGLLTVVNAVRVVADPEAVRCDQASTSIERVNDNDAEFDDIDLGEGEEAGDLACADRIELLTGADRCAAARDRIDEVNGNDDEDDDIDLGDDETVDGIDCERAIELAFDDQLAVPAAGTVRAFGWILILVGAIQLLATVLLLRRPERRVRILAIIGAVFGLFTLGGLGIIGLLVVGFVLYALVFSRDAKAVFGAPAGGGLFRPRGPAPGA